MTDQQIIQAIREGNPRKALEEIYTFFPKVKMYVQQNSGDEDQAKDIFQEAIVIFYEKAQTTDFKLTSSVTTYVFGVSKNLWYSKLRKLGKEIPSDIIQDTAIEIPEENKEEMFEQLELVVKQLGNKCQEILKQFYFLKASMKSISSNLGYSSVNAAKTQKYKCLERAKKLAVESMQINSH